jgi:hypothetical protein
MAGLLDVARHRHLLGVVGLIVGDCRRGIGMIGYR